jgi:hypothetical protein
MAVWAVMGTSRVGGRGAGKGVGLALAPGGCRRFRGIAFGGVLVVAKLVAGGLQRLLDERALLGGEPHAQDE